MQSYAEERAGIDLPATTLRQAMERLIRHRCRRRMSVATAQTAATAVTPFTEQLAAARPWVTRLPPAEERTPVPRRLKLTAR